jgi:predicted Zn-ribbon and HTH transcriptional regulator
MTLRERIVKNVLTRKRPFTTANISYVLGTSTRHTRRVLSELVGNRQLVKVNGITYITRNNTQTSGRA